MSTLAALRAEIERIDREIVRLLAERVRAAHAARVAKQAADLPTVDPAREAAVVRQACTAARGAGLNPEDVRDVFWTIVHLSRRAQLPDATTTE